MPNGSRTQPARSTYSELVRIRHLPNLTEPMRDELEFALDEIDRLRRIVDLLDRCLARTESDT